jgi:hypothetical protein
MDPLSFCYLHLSTLFYSFSDAYNYLMQARAAAAYSSVLARKERRLVAENRVTQQSIQDMCHLERYN